MGKGEKEEFMKFKKGDVVVLNSKGKEWMPS